MLAAAFAVHAAVMASYLDGAWYPVGGSGVFAREFVGVDNLMWSSDYPHSETTFPNSHAIIKRDFADRIGLAWRGGASAMTLGEALRRAGLAPGMKLLDLASGTGVVARGESCEVSATRAA